MECLLGAKFSRIPLNFLFFEGAEGLPGPKGYPGQPRMGPEGRKGEKGPDGQPGNMGMWMDPRVSVYLFNNK